VCSSDLCWLSSIFPNTISLAGRLIPLNGKITSRFFIGSGLGLMILPWLIGQLFENVGPLTTMIAILISLAAAVGVFYVISGYPMLLEPEEIQD
jgi:fucose permease